MIASIRKIHMAVLTVSLLFAAACGGASGKPNQATLTAQLNRSQQLATRMSQVLQSTSLATDLQLTATVQAFQALLQAADDWELVLPGDFDQASAAWVTGEGSNEYGSSKWTIAMGKLRWEAAATQGMVWWSIPEMPPVSDFYLSVDTRQINTPPDSLVGLTFRVTEDEEGYYLFQVDVGGNFAVYQLENNQWLSLLPWRPAPEYLPGQANQLAVLGQGAQFYFFINNVMVAEMFDENLAVGTTGLAIGLNNPGDAGTWEFERFQVSAPAGTFLTPTANP